MSEILRSPEARFANLPGFDYAPRYLEWRGMRIHYVDEQPAHGAAASPCADCSST